LLSAARTDSASTKHTESWYSQIVIRNALALSKDNKIRT
jgi:hypothetical protein